MKTKIGIRPVIDGRWLGVREGLEEQTMNMARAAQKLLEENCFYSDGAPAEVVIADTTIAGGKEAALAEEKFIRENVTATLSVTPCWCYGSETMDLNPLTTKAVWGFNGTERPGAVYLAAVMAAHAQRGLPAFAIYGHDVQDATDTSIPADVQEKLIRFAQCALAVGQLKNKAYVSIGSVAMGIGGSFLDPQLMQNYFNIRAEWVDMTEILRRIELGIYDKIEYEKELAWIKANCPEGADLNETLWERGPQTREEKDKQWEFTAKMTLIIKDIMLGNDKLNAAGFHEEALGRNAVLAGFQGQRMWTDYKPNADFPEAILSSTFDYTGKKEPIILATENDNCNGLAMLFSKLLTGQASAFADVRTYWSPDAVQRVSGWKPVGTAKDGFIHLLNSGAAALDGNGASKDAAGKSIMKKWWDVTDKDIKAMLEHTKWSPANRGYFRGGGYSSSFSTEGEMPITLVRVNMVKGLGYTLQIAEGWTVDLPANVNKILLDRTDPTWPSTWFVPRLGEGLAFSDVYSVMANWGANHGAFTYGHIGADLITFASMLRIPVTLHNVADKNIYRPHAWSAFGTRELESADYRACTTYGPLYK
ncbi:L-fucose isomerase [Spirochaetia bacterium]|nr:L-fucose isomerase [Spirochaetia bacterium]GHU31046.1 L-fucose isomerase [Spirochaetia bacterium]